jgi:hypothetical protein
MRGIRIVVFVLAAISACLLFSRVVGIDPWPQKDNRVDLGDQTGPPPEVPPPPPLPVQPAKKTPEPAKTEDAEPLAQAIAPAPENDPKADERPVVWTGDVQVLSSGSPAASAAPAPSAHSTPAARQTASLAESRESVPR